VVWVGTEASSRRPAFVVSPAAYGERTGFVIVCDIRPEGTGYPFEVAVPVGLDDCGVILADRVRSLHAQTWGVTRVCTLGDEIVGTVLAKLSSLTGETTE
jgi:mRNA interferase MazF